MTWGGLQGSWINCFQQFKIDYMEDPLKDLDNEFDGGYNTVFADKDLVKEGSLASVTINVPLDTIMNFRLSAGIVQDHDDDNVIWIEGPMVAFKSTESNGCGDHDRSHRHGPGRLGRWMPSFEGEDLEEKVSFSMDRIKNETVVVDWSNLNITNKDCLNGFAIEYRLMCRKCDYDYMPKRTKILVPQNQTKFDIPVWETNFIVSFIGLSTQQTCFSLVLDDCGNN